MSDAAQTDESPLPSIRQPCDCGQMGRARICEKIEAIPGVEAFRDDRDISGGDYIPEIIEDEIERSDEFLLLLTTVCILANGLSWK